MDNRNKTTTTHLCIRTALVLVILSVVKFLYFALRPFNMDQRFMLQQPLPEMSDTPEEIATTTEGVSKIVTTQPPYEMATGYTHLSTFQAPSTNVSEMQCFLQVQVWIHRKTIRKPRDYTCPGLTCNVRYVAGMSFRTMERSDALIYYYKSPWNFERMMKRRPEGQKWIFFTRESPQHIHLRLEDWKRHRLDYFMTYGRFGDIPNSYGYYDAHRPEIRAVDAQNWARNKSHLIAWVASNCHGLSWKRKEFVQKLSEQVHVDVYGKCGNLECKKNTAECDKLISSYKFYLALENSECRYYITEKFWKNSLEIGIVPLVYGAPEGGLRARRSAQLFHPPSGFCIYDGARWLCSPPGFKWHALQFLLAVEATWICRGAWAWGYSHSRVHVQCGR